MNKQEKTQICAAIAAALGENLSAPTRAMLNAAMILVGAPLPPESGPVRHGEWFRAVSHARRAAEAEFAEANRHPREAELVLCDAAASAAAAAGAPDASEKLRLLNALAFTLRAWRFADGFWISRPVEQWTRQPGAVHRVSLPPDMRLTALPGPGGQVFRMLSEEVVPAPRFWQGGVFLAGAVDLGAAR